MNIINLNINDRAALAIKNNTKRVEIRSSNQNNDYSKLNIGDIIAFNSQSLGAIYTKIKVEG